MCSTVYLAHMEPTLQAAGLLPRCLFHSLSLLPFLSLFLPTHPLHLPLHFLTLFSFVLLRSPPSRLIRFLCLCLLLSPFFTFFVPSLQCSAPRSYASSITTSTFLISVQPHPPGASSALLLDTWKPSETALLIPSLVSLPSVLSLFLPFHFPHS